MIKVEDQVNSIRSREEFAAFVRSLAQDFEEHPEAWQNADLSSFFEALAAWVDDMEGYYSNRGERMPEHPDWRTFAQILAAARVYE